MTFMNDRGQREADEFAERMQREWEASRTPESRDKAVSDYCRTRDKARASITDMNPKPPVDLDTGFHPKSTFGRRGNF